ncbi:hypothetical protein L484_017809 [Morus notabilis]|uniref:DC1 domain-containing protein n=1 Tax=Morus notabilis TaxID=981085 RepID=W9RC07_9ROSA|nr:hypothetical protein L484_017809 [Morus notabilis]
MSEKIRHFSHQHDLVLCRGGLEAPCGICNRLIRTDQNRYFGFECLYRIHEECAELKKKRTILVVGNPKFFN